MTAAGVNATALFFWVLCCSGLIILAGGISLIAVIATQEDRPTPHPDGPHPREGSTNPHEPEQ